jgi:hypothetical protein
MSWLFSQALVEVFLEDTSLDGEQFAPLSGSNTQQAYCAPDKMTDFSRLSRFGMTYKPLTENLGQELLTLFREDFHAKTLAQQEKAQELMESEAECGEKWLASFVKFDPSSSLWRTHQCSLLGDLEEFLETWPQWGLMRDGECWEQRTLEQTIKGTEFGLSEKLPTPTCGMAKHSQLTLEASQRKMNRSIQVRGSPSSLAIAVQAKWPTPKVQDSRHAKTRHLNKSDDHWKSNLGEVVSAQVNGGSLNPTWVEWLMGWPLGWTDLKPLEMDKSHCAPQQLGES